MQTYVVEYKFSPWADNGENAFKYTPDYYELTRVTIKAQTINNLRRTLIQDYAKGRPFRSYVYRQDKDGGPNYGSPVGNLFHYPSGYTWFVRDTKMGFDVDPKTGKGPYDGGSAPSKSATPAPRLKAAAKPAAKPKVPKKASGGDPGVLVGTVNGRLAPVNGFTYPKTLVKEFVKYMKTVYARMYDGEIDEDPWVDKGDKLLKTNKRLVAAIAVERQDLLTSDREIAAFAYALAHSKDKAKLLAMDSRPKAPAKKPAAKRVQSTFDRKWRA